MLHVKEKKNKNKKNKIRKKLEKKKKRVLFFRNINYVAHRADGHHDFLHPSLRHPTSKRVCVLFYSIPMKCFFLPNAPLNSFFNSSQPHHPPPPTPHPPSLPAQTEYSFVGTNELEVSSDNNHSKLKERNYYWFTFKEH